MEEAKLTDDPAEVAARLDGSVGRAFRQGRFPANDIISLLDVNRRFNLAESTTRDLTVAELLECVDLKTLADLPLGYGSSLGLPALREFVARRAGVMPDDVLTTPGSAFANALLMLELLREGDETLVFTPCFPPTRDVLKGIGAKVIQVPLLFEEHFQVDLERFRALLTPCVKLVAIASPQNPTGVVTPPEMIARLLSIMTSVAPDCYLLVEETYLDATYDGIVLESAAPLSPRVIVSSSVSKAHGAPGLRCGWLVVRDPALMSRLLTGKMNLLVSCSTLDESLAAAVLTRGGAAICARQQFLGDALRRVADFQFRHAHLADWIRPDAGGLCLFRLRKERFDQAALTAFWEGLAHHDLQLASGTWFGATTREFRVGFGYLPADELDGALSRLSMVLSGTARSGSGHELSRSEA